MKRRALLATVAATAAFAGCSGDDGLPTDTSTPTPTRNPTETPTETETESPTKTETESPTEIEPLKEPSTRATEDLPPECPVSTLDGFAPPDEITEETALDFVREYEVAYILDMFTAPLNEEFRIDRQWVARRYHGYAVSIYVSGSLNERYGKVRAEAIPSDRDPPSAADLQNDALRELVEEATQTHGEVTHEWRDGSIEYRGVVVPESARQDLESLSKDDGAYYVDVSGETVRLGLEEGPYAHYDFSHYTRYYVDSRVVRPVDNWTESKPEMRAREGELLECQ